MAAIASLYRANCSRLWCWGQGTHTICCG